MTDTIFKTEALFEHQFWLQILGDHSRFILNTLSQTELEKIQRSNYFIQIFDKLLEEAKSQLNDFNIEQLTQRAKKYSLELREFKLQLLREHLIGEVVIELPPTFINHMVNEVEEYLRVIHWLLNQEIPTAHPLYHHTIWLPDASGHADAIFCGLDSTERDLRYKSKEFTRIFDDLYIKADEFKGYLRTRLQDFPALSRLNTQVEVKILLFMTFLKEIEELRLTKKVVGTIMPLMANHMFREECYYLTKLSKVSEIEKPECDPTSPRIGS